MPPAGQSQASGGLVAPRDWLKVSTGQQTKTVTRKQRRRKIEVICEIAFDKTADPAKQVGLIALVEKQLFLSVR